MSTGFLLLKDAGLHAVIADTMPRGGAHRVIDGHDGQRADGIAVTLDRVHLGDFLVKRAAGEFHAEHAGTEGASFSFRPVEQLSLPWLWHLMQ